MEDDVLSLLRSRVQSHWGAKIPQAEAQKKKKKKGKKAGNLLLHRLFGKSLCSHFITKIIVTVALLGFIC